MKYSVTILEVKLPTDVKLMSKSVKGLIKPMKALSASTIIHFKVDKDDEITVGDVHTFEKNEFELKEITNDNGTYTLFKVI